MVKYENDCMGCATESYPCIGESCKYRHVPHLYCDECGSEVNEGDLYELDDGRQYCVDCLLPTLLMDLTKVVAE